MGIVTQMFKDDPKRRCEILLRRTGFTEMQSKTVTSAIDSFGHLVYEYVEEGRYEDAKAFVQALREKTIAAFETFDEMIEEDLKEHKKS